MKKFTLTLTQSCDVKITWRKHSSEQLKVLGEAVPWSLRTYDLFDEGVVVVLRL